jgi:fucose 4-O-acetylase-like acetyltransferase
MTIVIWSHWIGKWGMQDTAWGWLFLNWSFTFHVVGFVFLSGVNAERSARAALGPQRELSMGRIVGSCVDLFFTYIWFSWLRCVAILLPSHVHLGVHLGVRETVSVILRGTFLFQQAPWYLAAMIMWRLASPTLLWARGVSLVVVFAAAAFCPYQVLSGWGDPFAIREALHYLPFFTVGLLCGQARLERLLDGYGRLAPWFGFFALGLIMALLCGPLQWLCEHDEFRWILIKKDMPPAQAGGIWLMVALYMVKGVAALSAVALFSATGLPRVVEAAVETAGQRSLNVYLVHMVFVMVPGEVICVEHFLEAAEAALPGHAFCVGALLAVFAVAINFLCGSALTAACVGPFVRPWLTQAFDQRAAFALSHKVSWRHLRLGGSP